MSGKATNADTYAWLGVSAGLWSAAGDWQDAATGAGPAQLVPGPLTPVLIANPGTAPVAIGGTGTAASVGLTGPVDLAGTYAIGGALGIGSAAGQASVAGTLALQADGTIAAGTIAVLDGALDLAAGAQVTTTGTLAVGSPPASDGAQAGGAVTVAANATLLAAGPLLLQNGTVADAGGRLSVAGFAAIGGAALDSAAGANAPAGRLAVTHGGSTTVSGDLSLFDGMVVVDGAGSRLVVGGTLTTGIGDQYTYYAGSLPTTHNGALIAVNGGIAQLGGLVLDAPSGTPFADTVVEVDGASSVEIGAAGAAAAGAIVIDAGNTVAALTDAGLYGALIDNGVLLVSGGTLVQSGDVSGTGTVAIGHGATWLLNGSIAPTVTIGFLDTGAVLAVGGYFDFTGTSYDGASYAPGAVLAGFQPGDAIALLDPINAAVYTPGANNDPGTLTLSYGGATVQAFHLAGNFAGDTFTVTPTAAGGSVVTVRQAQTTASQTAAAQSANADAYGWTGSGGGSWNGATNWRDATANTKPAAAVPGPLTAVTINGPTGAATATIAGDGTAASIGLTGSIALVGRYTVGGAINVGSLAAASSGQADAAVGALELASGTTVAAATVDTINGRFWADPGTAITSTGSVIVGSAPSAATPAATSVFGVSAGAALAVGGGLLVNAGSLADAGGVVTVAGGLGLGSARNGTLAAASGSAVVTNGGTMTVNGAIVDANGVAVADGVGSVLRAQGTMTASGAGLYTAVGLTTQTADTASLIALNNGFAQVAGLVLNASTGAAGVLVDGQSTIEVGAAGGAARGALTVDPNRSVVVNSGSASLTGSLVNNGTVLINGGTLALNGGVSGSGTIVLGSNASLALNGAVSGTETIALSGTGAVLAIGSTGSNGTGTLIPVAAVINGFQAGDTLLVSQPLTAGSFTPAAGGGTGTLLLSNNGITVGSLTLAGNYAGIGFSVAAANGAAAVTAVGNAATLGVASLGTAALTRNGSLLVLDLGTAQLGGAAPTDTLSLGNNGGGNAAALGASFTLLNTAGFVNNGFVAGIGGLGAGQSEAGQSITLSTGSLGVFSETVVVHPLSSGSLGNAVLPDRTIAVTGTVALPPTTVGVLSLGTAALNQSGTVWTLDLGTATVGGAALGDAIGIADLMSGTAGTLSGSFGITGNNGFTNTGFASGFSGLTAGGSEARQLIGLATGTAGVFTETITVAPTLGIGSANTRLPGQTIVVTGTVALNNQTFTLTGAPATIAAGAGNDTFNAPSGALNSQDGLDGGGGANTLNLLGGGGVFDLGAPRQLANIQSVTATEGGSPTTIYTRAGSAMTLTLLPAAGGGGSATIYGAVDGDVFNLSTGADTVVLGSANEVVRGGGGTATIQATSGLAGAIVIGGSVGTTTLAITTGGTATLAAADANLTVTLSAATHLNLGTARFVTAIGSGGADTITAGGSAQTLVANGGAALLIGYDGGGDTFAGTTGGLNGVAIQNFGANDTIDLTDLAFGSLRAPSLVASGSGNTYVTALGVSDGARAGTITLGGYYAAAQLSTADDGHGGVRIGFVKT